MIGQLYSFDVYDTLITRRTATPEGIFALMQKRLTESETYADYPKLLLQNFYLIRIESEKVARNTYISGDVYDITLSQIYECIRLSAELSEEQIKRLMQLEIETELENSIPIIENIKKVRVLKEKEERVVLISNMYLGTDVIRRILAGMDTVFENITIYVSGDLGRTKGTGTLYQYVREKEDVEFSNWYHFGDNRILDVEIPNRFGIRAEHFHKTDLYEWERELLKGRENSPQLQIMLGLSKRVHEGMEVTFPYQVGSGYSAEILLPYVLWVLHKSIEKGIQKLYFIARDGYILKKMSDILIHRYNFPIETSYLYGSRRAWRLPSINPKKFELNTFFKWHYPGQIYSYQRIAEILGLTIEELKLFLPFVREDIELSKPLVQEIIGILGEQQEQLAEFISKKYEQQKKEAVSYLYQEIGNEKREFAFVDLIGSGYTQKCLADLMADFFKRPIQTFFYRLDYCITSENNINYAFFPNRIKMGNIIEVLCAAPHGQTNGYECRNDTWIPVLGTDEGENLEAYGFSDYIKGIVDYTEEFAVWFAEKPLSLYDLRIIELYFDYMAEAGNKKLYDYIADMPYGISGQEKAVTSFAPRLSNQDLGRIYFWNKGEPIKKYYSGYSLEFSLLRLLDRQKEMLRFYEKYSERAVVRWIRNRIFNAGSKVCDCRYELIADHIVLYGAGKKGKLLHQQLTQGKQYHADIVLWVDRDYLKYREEGMEVHSPECIRQVVCQQVVIAVANAQTAEEIKESLTIYGIGKARMIWLCPDCNIR